MTAAASPSPPPPATATGPARVSVAFLAQENLPVPPAVPGSSVSRVVHELARELVAQQATDVTVCSLPHPAIGEGVHEDGVRYLRVPAGLDARRHDAYKQVLRVLRRLDLPHRELQGLRGYGRRYARSGLTRLAAVDPDVVHLQNVSQFVPVARRSAPGARIALHMHCDWLLQLPPRTVRPRLASADLVLGVSDYITDGIRRAFPELAGRCRTLRNGVDTDEFVPRDRLPAAAAETAAALREELGGGPVVLYVGTLAPEKGSIYLLEAFREAVRRVPDARLVVVGNHNRYFQVSAPRGRRRRRELRLLQRGYPAAVARAAEPLGDHVVFAGGIEHDRLPAWYGAADAFVMPSTGHEPCPLPVLEALASGLPVVATSRGGLPELVRDGEDGLLVPPADARALAGAITSLLVDPGGARSLGATGRARAEEELTWRARARLLRGYYEQILDRPACPT